MKRLLATLFCTLVTLTASARDVELSWEKAVVFAPGSETPNAVNDLKIEKRYPVLLYLHGCTGIADWHDYGWAKLISKEGVIVVITDSMARPNRIPNCDPKAKRGINAFPQAFQYRQQEIAYALDRLNSVPWSDPKNLFLMGHSEGGVATATTNHRGFKAHIISGWTCTNRTNRNLHGIDSPSEVPILVIAALKDEWRVGTPQEGRCVENAQRRKVTQVDLNGSVHATIDYPDAREAVVKFLKEQLSR